jgi:hypothetical protein
MVRLRTGELAVSGAKQTTILTRNARFLWLAALFVPPLFAFVTYQWTPHEELWHEVLYSLLCVPIFCFWLIALFGCVISFLSYRSTAHP